MSFWGVFFPSRALVFHRTRPFSAARPAHPRPAHSRPATGRGPRAATAPPTAAPAPPPLPPPRARPARAARHLGGAERGAAPWRSRSVSAGAAGAARSVRRSAELAAVSLPGDPERAAAPQEAVWPPAAAARPVPAPAERPVPPRRLRARPGQSARPRVAGGSGGR